MGSNRDDVENNFTFVGFMIMENRLKPATVKNIAVLHSALIKTIMVTGTDVF